MVINIWAGSSFGSKQAVRLVWEAVIYDSSPLKLCLSLKGKTQMLCKVLHINPKHTSGITKRPVLNACGYTLRRRDANTDTHTYRLRRHSLSNRKGHVGQVLGSHEFSELFLLLSFASHG